MRPLLLFAFLSLASLTLTAQEQETPVFDVSVSADTILLGENFSVSFSINTYGSDFQAPDFSDLRLVGGPNTASSTTIIQGKVSQSLTFTYFLEPKEIGSFFIGPAAISITGGEILETLPIEVQVLPNEGYRPPEEKPKAKKKKRKITRI